LLRNDENGAKNSIQNKKKGKNLFQGLSDKARTLVGYDLLFSPILIENLLIEIKDIMFLSFFSFFYK
jgi:hypothetical protein